MTKSLFDFWKYQIKSFSDHKNSSLGPVILDGILSLMQFKIRRLSLIEKFLYQVFRNARASRVYDYVTLTLCDADGD